MDSIDPNQPRLVIRRVNKALAALAKNPDVDTVHHFRTSSRRFEAVLELLGHPTSRDEIWLDKQLSKLRRRAGKVRDLDVQTEDLKELQIGRDGDHKEKLLEALARRRRREERRLERTLEKADLKEIRKRLNELSTRFRTRGRQTAGERALTGFARLSRQHGVDSDASLHDFRKQAKKLRYLAELGDDVLSRTAAVQLQNLQDSVGEWHDWAELTARAEKLLGPNADCALVTAMRNITGAKLNTARQVTQESRRALLVLQRERLRLGRRPPLPAVVAKSVAKQAAG